MTLARWAAGKAALIFMATSDKTPAEFAAEIERLKHELGQSAAAAELQRVVARQRLKYANAKASVAQEDTEIAQRLATIKRLEAANATREVEILRSIVTTPAPVEAMPAGPLISQLIARYIEVKKTKGDWGEKALETNKSIFSTLLEICEDIPIDSFTPAMAEDFAQKIGKLPANRSRLAHLKGKTIEQLLFTRQLRVDF